MKQGMTLLLAVIGSLGAADHLSIPLINYHRRLFSTFDQNIDLKIRWEHEKISMNATLMSRKTL